MGDDGDELGLHALDVADVGDVVEDDDGADGLFFIVTHDRSMHLIDILLFILVGNGDLVGLTAPVLRVVLLAVDQVRVLNLFNFAADDLQAVLISNDLGQRPAGGVFALFQAKHGAGLGVHLTDALMLIDQDQPGGEAFEGMDELLLLLDDLLEQLGIGDDRRRVAGEPHEQAHVFFNEFAAIALIEAMEDADHDAVYQAVLFVAFLDEQGNSEAVVDTQLLEEGLFGARHLRYIVKNEGLPGTEDLAGDAGIHANAELGDLVLFEPKGGRAGYQVAGFPVADHNDALLGLQDHGDALHQALERLLKLGNGHRRLTDDLSSTRPGAL